MMALGSRLITALTGGLWPSLVLPMILLGFLVSLHNNWLARDERLRNEGKQLCEAGWQDAIRKEERAAAEKRAASMASILESERALGESLRHELHKLETESMELRAKAAGGDARCLSDGVLDNLRKRQQGGGGKKQGL